MAKIEIISRAIIEKKEKILVCRDKINENYFLPGGHVEFGEFSEKALLRELKEELSLETEDIKIIGIAENMYEAKGKFHHEINFVYHVKGKQITPESNEEHIEFSLFNYKEFEKRDVRPKKLKNAVLLWKKNKKFFYITINDQ